jgi:two-component system, LuxR family, response regulator FixJ
MMITAQNDLVSVIDDDLAACESVAALVRSRGLTANTYASAEDFLQSHDRRIGGCLVVDLRMPGMSGVELQERLSQEGITLPIIMVTGFGDISNAVRAMKNGALTFLEKPCTEQSLWTSISEALNRQADVRQKLFQRIEIRDRLKTLTADEFRVLEKLIEGKSNKVIASKLDIGLRTVEFRRALILKKMQVSSLPELVRVAMVAFSENGDLCCNIR